jgi:hypothetical protein
MPTQPVLRLMRAATTERFSPTAALTLHTHLVPKVGSHNVLGHFLFL